MDTGMVLFVLSFLLIRFIVKARLDRHMPERDQQIWNDVQHQARMHDTFSSVFHAKDIVYKSALARLSNEPDSVARIEEVDRTLRQVTNDLRSLSRDVADFSTESENNRRLKKGYAKERADYYRSEWVTMQRNITNRSNAISKNLQALRGVSSFEQ